MSRLTAVSVTVPVRLAPEVPSVDAELSSMPTSKFTTSLMFVSVMVVPLTVEPELI